MNSLVVVDYSTQNDAVTVNIKRGDHPKYSSTLLERPFLVSFAMIVMAFTEQQCPFDLFLFFIDRKAILPRPGYNPSEKGHKRVFVISSNYIPCVD